ncbi:MAG: hypothetical protein ACREQ5_31725 [Candidatus Dormibacteria bacterium]
MQPPPPPTSGGLPPGQQQDALVPAVMPPSARRLQRPRPNRRVVIGVLVLLVALLTVVTALLARPHSDTSGPDAAATAYFSAQDRHDFRARWALMTPRFQSGWTSESAFITYEEKFYRDTQGECCLFSQIYVRQASVTGNQAVVTVTRIRKADGSNNPDTGYLRIVNDIWLVDGAGEKPPPGWSTR